MTSAESIFYWITAILAAGAFFWALLSLIFKKSNLLRISGVCLLPGFLTLTVFGIIRWANTGHPPFVTLFESMITSIWFILLIFLIVYAFNKKTCVLMLPVSLVTLLMIGWSSSMSAEGTPLSAALTNVWLFIHASFATSGAASFLISASFGMIYLMGEDRLKAMEKIAARIPEYNKIPAFIMNFLIFGLILWGVMIVSGSIWANIAWGRYWAWDPIELWSLISWLIYGLLIHTRITFKISKRLFSLLTIIAALIVAFSLWGVGYFYETIHSYG